jgi:hypothetical protein
MSRPEFHQADDKVEWMVQKLKLSTDEVEDIRLKTIDQGTNELW